MSLLYTVLRSLLLALVACIMLLTAHNASCHEVRPAYLGLNETAVNRYDVVWKQPVLGDKRLRLTPVLPSQCMVTIPMQEEALPGALLTTWGVVCAANAFQREAIGVDGLSSSLTDVWVVVRSQARNEEDFSARLTAAEPRVWLHRSARASISGYFGLGVKHLLGGADHILFVIGLMFFVSGFPGLARTITAFTVAHSITLAGAVLKLVHMPQGPVEACIMLSILYLAVEASSADRPATLTARAPWRVAFGFGLLHGLGFAGALQDIGLPTDSLAPALLMFNLGIEAGQLIVIGSLLLLQAAMSRFANRPPGRLAYLPVFAMGSLSCYWLLSALWGTWQTAQA